MYVCMLGGFRLLVRSARATTVCTPAEAGAPTTARAHRTSRASPSPTRGPLPHKRFDFGAAYLNGKIYLVGGRTDTGFAGPNQGLVPELDEYDPATDTWRTLASMPLPRYRLGVVAYQGKIWATGGCAA